MQAYRKDIDGLRAIAVLTVVLFHAGFSGFSGGYIGVDVFFVISGYLITNIILHENQKNSFSLSKFYMRRIRRILPALFVVTLSSFILAAYLFIPDELMDFTKSVMAILFFVSNHYFLGQEGYFATSSLLKHMHHTWSLAVEEQFYLLFPILLILVLSRPRRVRLFFFAFVFFLSLFLAHWYSISGSLKGFYLIGSRSWELLSGAFLAILNFKYPIPRLKSALIQECIVVVGLLAIFWSVYVFNPTTRHPGLITLIPVLGTVSVIYFNQYSRNLKWSFSRLILENKFSVGIGLISYSFYLWHYPVFAFARYMQGQEPAHHIFLILILLCLLLSYITWRWIETPFRDKNKIKTKNVLIFSATAMALLLTLCFFTSIYKGFPSRFSAADLKMFGSHAKSFSYVTSYYEQLSSKKPFEDSSDKKILLIGDSYSQDFMNVILEGALWEGHQFRTLYIPTACQIYFGYQNISEVVMDKDYGMCEKFYADKTQISQLIEKADVVILASYWQLWAVERLQETIDFISQIKLGVKIWVIGSKSFGNLKLRELLRSTHEQKLLVRREVEDPEEFLEINRILKTDQNSYHFVDVHALFCGDNQSTTCPIFTNEGELISFDGRHLTKSGATWLGQRLKAQGGF